MANSTAVKMTIEALTKYGFKANGAYVNWGKLCPEADKGKVVPGGAYEFEVFTAESGKQYVNKLLSKAAPILSDVAPAKAVDTERAKKYTPEIYKKSFVKKADDSMSKDEWAAKDVRISRQGCIQAAVQAVAPLVKVELVFAEAEKLANQMLEFVNRK